MHLELKGRGLGGVSDGGVAGAAKSILCIEDDRETAAVVCEDLTDRGFDVRLAHNGDEGLRAILKTLPDLVLCDISLPLMSGFEILERLTAVTPRLGRMPFVFLTAFTDRENELKGRRLGADDYVTKPMDFDVSTPSSTRGLHACRAQNCGPRTLN